MTLSTNTQNETDIEQSLSEVIYEYLITNGFLPTSKGTCFYKNIIENIVLFLNSNPNAREIEDLKEELVRPFSAFYLNIAIESGAFFKNEVTNNSIDKPLEPLIMFHQEIASSIKNSQLFLNRSKGLSKVLKNEPNKFYMMLSYYIGQYIYNLTTSRNIKMLPIECKKLIYFYIVPKDKAITND